LAYKNKVLIISLLSETYLFSLKKFQKSHTPSLQKNYTVKLNKMCEKGDPHPRMKIHEFGNTEEKEQPEPETDPETKSTSTTENPSSSEILSSKVVMGLKEDELRKVIDFDKIVIVDSFDSLKVAKSYAESGITDIGIDLEGSLGHNGHIELI
jgi:hypothetical protein